MASVQTQRMPQVGFLLDQPFNSSVSIPFNSIRISGHFNPLHGRDNRDAAFWDNTLVAEVNGRSCLAKIYTQSLGGERAFAHDLVRLLNDKDSSIPKVLGHSSDSATPCILFATSRVVPFHACLGEILQVSPETALQDAWQLLIDLKNAAEGLIRNYPSLPSSVLRDALAKASVDDQGKIVLTPEIDGPPHNFDDSVEQLVETAWSEFLQSGQYRELRSLGFALAGDPNAVLGKSPREFKTSASASQYLQQFWVSPSQRWLQWPSEIKGTFEPGDLGVFEVQPGRGRIFRKLESVSTELGGIMTKVNSSHFEEVQPGVYRATCNPLKEGDHVKPSLDCFILSWSNRLKDAQTERDWLCANANRLAATHGVASEDLVLLTKTMHSLDVKPLARLSRRIQKPIYLYVHISDNGTAFKRYWTFQDSPTLVGSQQETPRNSEISGLPLPDVEMYFGDHPHPTRYLQLEIGEI